MSKSWEKTLVEIDGLIYPEQFDDSHPLRDEDFLKVLKRDGVDDFRKREGERERD